MFRKRTYSEKLKKRADCWLEQFDRSLESLTKDEQAVIFEHVKKLHLKNWLWLFFMAGFMWLIAGFYGYFVSTDCIQQNMETIAGTGIENIDSLLIEETTLIQYQLSGMSFACFMIALFCFFMIWMFLYHCAKNEKVIRVFLNNSKS